MSTEIEIDLRVMVAGAITEVPAHAGTIRNRMLSAYRGKPQMALAIGASAADIDRVAKTLSGVIPTTVCGICRPSGRARDVAKHYLGWRRAK